MKKLSIIITSVLALLIFHACSSQESSSYYDESDEGMYMGGAEQEEDQLDLVNNTESIVSKSKVMQGTNQQSLDGSLNQNIEEKHQDIISSKGFTNPYKDKKFIKTASIRFKVEKVYASSIAIEKIVLAHDGFIINSNLSSDVIRSEEFPKDATTNIRIEEYESINYITLRIPNEQLHESLVQIGNEIEFLDYRVLNADDVGLSLLEQELNIKRAAQNQSLIKSNMQGNAKLDDKLEAAAMEYERQIEIDLAKLKQLTIEDQVTYSTITIEIYENSKLYQSEVPNFDAYRAQFKASYTQELGESFLVGINIVKLVFKTLVAIWPFILIAFGISLFIYKKKSK